MNNYGEEIFKNPKYEKTFRDFVFVQEGKEELVRRNSNRLEDVIQHQLKERMLKEDEDLIGFG